MCPDGKGGLVPCVSNPATGNALTVLAASDVEVPEPAAWVLLVGGFGLMGAALRVRRPGLTPA
jgi:hypothetical protein